MAVSSPKLDVAHGGEKSAHTRALKLAALKEPTSSSRVSPSTLSARLRMSPRRAEYGGYGGGALGGGEGGGGEGSGGVIADDNGGKLMSGADVL